MACFMIAAFGSLSYTEYVKKECRIEAIKAGKSVDDIEKICK